MQEVTMEVTQYSSYFGPSGDRGGRGSAGGPVSLLAFEGHLDYFKTLAECLKILASLVFSGFYQDKLKHNKEPTNRKFPNKKPVSC